MISVIQCKKETFIECKKDRAIFLLLPSIMCESANAHITMEAFFAEAAANHSDVW